MERKRQAQQFLTRAAEVFDLPADLMAGLCHMEILGDRQMFLEGHKGILAYGTERIDINAGTLVVSIQGRDLTLKSMTDSEVRIQGEIARVEYVK